MILWWIGNVVLLAAVLLAALLAHRVIVQAMEIRRYADDILVHGVGLAGTLDPVPALAETADLVTAVADRAGAYVGALDRRLSS
jgi:hypothetical protein